MKIVVFIKQIPASNEVKIDPITNNLIRSSAAGRINPYDENALEAALTLKDKYNAEVIVVSMGPPSSKQSLREALALGCDKAYLLSSRAFGGSDTLATAYTLAQAIKKIKDVDLMFFGIKAIDADTGQVPPLVAEQLNIGQITDVNKIIDLKDNVMTLAYTNEFSEVVVQAKLPLVLSVGDDLNEVRYQTPLNIKQSAKKEIVIWDENDLDCDLKKIGIKGSATVVTDSFVADKSNKNTIMLNGSTSDVVLEFVDILKARNII